MTVRAGGGGAEVVRFRCMSVDVTDPGDDDRVRILLFYCREYKEIVLYVYIYICVRIELAMSMRVLVG